MIIIHAVLPVRPDARDDFLAAVSDLLEASNAEPGVLEYALHESVTTRGTFTMVERFTDQTAVDVHLSSVHFSAATAALSGWVSGAPRLTRYLADEGEDLDLG